MRNKEQNESNFEFEMLEEPELEDNEAEQVSEPEVKKERKGHFV